MSKLDLEYRIKQLEEKHHNLDKKIKEEYIRYGGDGLVNSMKKEKLHLKEEIERYKRQLETV